MRREVKIGLRAAAVVTVLLTADELRAKYENRLRAIEARLSDLGPASEVWAAIDSKLDKPKPSWPTVTGVRETVLRPIQEAE